MKKKQVEIQFEILEQLLLATVQCCMYSIPHDQSNKCLRSFFEQIFSVQQRKRWNKYVSIYRINKGN